MGLAIIKNELACSSTQAARQLGVRWGRWIMFTLTCSFSNLNRILFRFFPSPAAYRGYIQLLDQATYILMSSTWKYCTKKRSLSVCWLKDLLEVHGEDCRLGWHLNRRDSDQRSDNSFHVGSFPPPPPGSSFPKLNPFPGPVFEDDAFSL